MTEELVSLVIAVTSAVVGWLTRTYLPSRQPAHRPPARRNDGKRTTTARPE